jgi:hypothetical protein
MVQKPRILLLGASDVRHILAGAKHNTHIEYYIHETSPLTVARALLLLYVLSDVSVGGVRERAEIFLSLYSNVVVRERDIQYIRNTSKTLIDILTESGNSGASFRDFVDFSHLKLRERDAIQATLERWRSCHVQSTAFHDRLVNFFKTRFDYRENLLDWQYHTTAKLACSVLHWAEYKRFGMTGVAFEPRLASCVADNVTMMAPRSRAAMNDNAYPGDIGNCALANFAKRAVNKQDQERLFRRVNGNQPKCTAAEAAEYNVTAMIAAADNNIFTLAPEKTEEREFPFFSPMAVLNKIEEVEEELINGDFRLVENFRKRRIHFLSGEVRTVAKRGNFDVVFIGALASATLIQHPAVIADLVGSFCVVESLDNNALVDKQTKIRWRERMSEVAKNLGWILVKDAFSEDPELLVYQKS